jgi:hypothetical protein
MELTGYLHDQVVLARGKRPRYPQDVKPTGPHSQSGGGG